MEYQFVTKQEEIELRKLRLRNLELDHCSAKLAWEESPNDKQRQSDMSFFEQAIKYHRQILGNMLAEQGMPSDPETSE